MRINLGFNYLSCDLVTTIKNSELTKVVVQNKKIIAIAAAILSAIAVVSYAVYYFRRKVELKTPVEKDGAIQKQIPAGVGAKEASKPMTHSNNSLSSAVSEEKVLASAARKGKVLRGTVPGTLPNLDGFAFSMPNMIWNEDEFKYDIKGYDKITVEELLNYMESEKINYASVTKLVSELFDDDANDGFRLLSYLYSSCFHTTESHEEILARLEKILQNHVPFPEDYPTYTNLVVNLLRLHKMLPGPHCKKKAKIYWDEKIEQYFFPKMFNSNGLEHVKFKLVEGEEFESSFQDEHIDFKNQLEWVYFDEKKFGEAVMNIFEDLLGDNFEESLDKLFEQLKIEFEGKFPDKILKENRLISESYPFLFVCNLFYNIKKLKQDQICPNFKAMSVEEQTKTLLSIGRNQEHLASHEHQITVDFPLVKVEHSPHPDTQEISDDFSYTNPQYSLEETIIKIAKNDAIPKLAYGKVLKGKEPRIAALNSPYLENSSCDKDPDFQDITALFDVCFHTTESHEEILERIVAIQKAQYPDENSSEFGNSFQILFVNLLKIHEHLSSTYGKGEKKIYWSDRAEKLLFPQLMKFEDFGIGNRLIFEPLAGEIVKGNVADGISAFDLQVLYHGIDRHHIQSLFDDLLYQIYGNGFSSQFKDALYEKNDQTALKVWDYASSVQADFKGCVLDHLILMNTPENIISTKSLEEKINMMKSILGEVKGF